MNANELSKGIGSLFKLRPLPQRVDEVGEAMAPIDDEWRLDGVLRNPTRVSLTNVSTGHTVQLEWDNVIERRSPAFLMLRCQLTLRASSIDIEPIYRGAPILPDGNLGARLSVMADTFLVDLWRAKPQSADFTEAIAALVGTTRSRIQDFRQRDPEYLRLPTAARAQFDALIRELDDLAGRSDDGVWYSGFTIHFHLRSLVDLVHRYSSAS